MGLNQSTNVVEQGTEETGNVKMDGTGREPTIGAGVLLSNGQGWEPAALLLPSPLVLLRFDRGVARLYAMGSDTPFLTTEREPIALLMEVLVAIRAQLPVAGPKAGKPAFPLALIAATYEFGARFAPHRDAFPHAAGLEDDELFAAVFIDAFRPDSRGEVERIGYAGTVPAGWMEGAPELETAPPGHVAPPVVAHPTPNGVQHERLRPLMEEGDHAERIKRIHEYLAAGDIYQANLTVPFRGRTAAAAEAIFDAALQRGGAAWGGTMITPLGTLLSFSPELYLRRRGPHIETRPIKGTARIANYATAIYDATETLRTSDKDRAEHVMIVDLERNDLGRVCLPGTVTADPLMRLVEHPTVLHMESTVSGELRFDVTPTEIIAATYPGGSVTGAPKKRALEILGELEIAPRGIYCGAFGWIDADGDMELNLPIRTAMLRPDGTIEYSAGGGIVADSDAAEEWKELHHKLRFFEEALETAETRSDRNGAS